MRIVPHDIAKIRSENEYTAYRKAWFLRIAPLDDAISTGKERRSVHGAFLERTVALMRPAVKGGIPGLKDREFTNR
ncbi:MAG TPA: hypothetical protein VMD47_06095 [Candidatus Acidoferrales bacterium]|nr:hypothetical protein [Candidatus Acidoferrales bacterium]